MTPFDYEQAALNELQSKAVAMLTMNDMCLTKISNGAPDYKCMDTCIQNYHALQNAMANFDLTKDIETLVIEHYPAVPGYSAVANSNHVTNAYKLNAALQAIVAELED